ncbi:MAG: class I SAM-dependent methyltransferase [Pyrinomonadaceae bacterium]
MSQQSMEVSPIRFFETVNAYAQTEALKAAIELNLFTAIGEGHETAKALAEKLDVAERGARILCNYLVIIGILSKEGDSYRLTPDSAAFLDRRSPAYLGGAIEFLLAPKMMEGFSRLTEAVRRGGTALEDEGTIAPENPVWVKFARAMMPMMAMPAQWMAKLVLDNSKFDSTRKLKVLDIAAGHGIFGIAFAQQNPNVEVTALDWPAVLEVAKENAERAGLSGRYKTIAGSAFEVDYGEGYDLVLLTNFLHHFDPPTCEQLLKKVRAALSEGGRAVTLEFIPNEDRVTPPGPAAFSLTMLASTPRGDAYTFPELESMFKNAGFSRSELHPLPPTFEQVVISDK